MLGQRLRRVRVELVFVTRSVQSRTFESGGLIISEIDTFLGPPQSIVEAASPSKSEFPDGSTLSDLGSLAFTTLISHSYRRLYRVWLG
jgi:hypothetical protein